MTKPCYNNKREKEIKEYICYIYENSMCHDITHLFLQREMTKIEDLDIGPFLGVRLALEAVSLRSGLDCQRFNGRMTDSLSDTVREILADSGEY